MHACIYFAESRQSSTEGQMVAFLTQISTNCPCSLRKATLSKRERHTSLLIRELYVRRHLVRFGRAAASIRAGALLSWSPRPNKVERSVETEFYSLMRIVSLYPLLPQNLIKREAREIQTRNGHAGSHGTGQITATAQVEFIV